MSALLPYSGYFFGGGGGGGGGKIFMVERQTMKFLPTKQYRIVGRSHTYCTVTKKISMNWQKIHCYKNFTSPKNTCYMVLFCVVGDEEGGGEEWRRRGGERGKKRKDGEEEEGMNMRRAVGVR